MTRHHRSHPVTAAQFCRQQAYRSRSSFLHAMRLMPAAPRRAMFALYAFCRMVDDLVDEPLPELSIQPAFTRSPQARLTGLHWWRQEIQRVFASDAGPGQATHPVSLELAWAQTRFRLTPEPFLAILDGMEMDLAGTEYTTLADLEQYSSRVSTAVGHIIFRILVFPRDIDASTDGPFMHHLGMALQLTNILRDVVADLDRGRLYLPAEWMTRHGVTRHMLGTRPWDQQVESLLGQLGDEAAHHYDRVEQLTRGYSRQEQRQLVPALLMAAIYRFCLARMAQTRYNVQQHPCRLSIMDRLRCAWRAWRQMGRRR